MWIESLEGRSMFSAVPLAVNPIRPANRPTIRQRLLKHRPLQLTAMVTGSYIGDFGTIESSAGVGSGFQLDVWVGAQSPRLIIGGLQINNESGPPSFNASISHFRKQGVLGPGWYFAINEIYTGLRIKGVFEANSYAMKLQVSGPLVKRIPKAERTVIMSGNVY